MYFLLEMLNPHLQFDTKFRAAKLQQMKKEVKKLAQYEPIGKIIESIRKSIKFPTGFIASRLYH